MGEFLNLLTDEGLAVFLLIALLPAIGYFFRWFLNNYTARIDSKFEESIREMSEIKREVMNSNNKLYDITSSLIKNSRIVGEDINAIESSLNTLLKFINKNGK